MLRPIYKILGYSTLTKAMTLHCTHSYSIKLEGENGLYCKVIGGHQLFNTLSVHPEYKKVNFLTIKFLSAMHRKLTILTEAE
jgi:hypothetical protein